MYIPLRHERRKRLRFGEPEDFIPARATAFDCFCRIYGEKVAFYRSPYTTLPPTIVVFTFVLRMASGFSSKMLSLTITMSASLPGETEPFSLS